MSTPARFGSARQPRFERTDLTVGQALVVSGGHSGPIEREVVKVGRTLVHVTTRWPSETEAFRLDTGMENQANPRRHIATVAEHQATAARGDAERAATQAGLRWDYGVSEMLTIDELYEVSRIVQAARDRGERQR